MTAILLTILLAGCGYGESDPGAAAGITPPPDSPASVPAPAPAASFFAPDFATTGQTFPAIADQDSSTAELQHPWQIRQAGSNASLTDNRPAAFFVADPTGGHAISQTVTDPNGQSNAPSRNLTALPPIAGSTITSIDIRSLDKQSKTDTDVPVTFGQVFVRGQIPAGFSVSARLKNGAAAPLQVDAKARYADGSLKHAVLSSIIPSLRGGEQLTLVIISCAEVEPVAPVQISELPAEYDVVVSLAIDDDTYTASLRHGRLSSEPSYWLQGPVATEAHYQAPFVDANDNTHPLLTARFQLRVHPEGKVRTDVIVENTSAFVRGASNIDYTARITAGGSIVMPAEQIKHHHHSRWRKTLWRGRDPNLHLEFDVAYLISTGAIPNFDRTISFSPSALSSIQKSWESKVGSRSKIPINKIMGAGLATEGMPRPGGRPDIGILPGWTSLYLLTMDERAALGTYGSADAAAHWPVHYRDSKTRLPLSLEEHPGTTVHSNVLNRRSNPLPKCLNCKTGMHPDTAHQPSLVFVPYLLTGNHYYLEELHFWTNFNSFQTHPRNRDYGDAVYRWQQVRGQAWSMRTLLQTVFITPDDHPLKGYFQTQLDNNFDFYMSEYVSNPNANALGYINHGAPNPHNTLEVSVWMDDFFTAVLNYGRHLGFERTEPILDWKIQFAMKRMHDSVYCWQFATIYHLIASLPGPGAIYENMADMYIPTLQDQFPENWKAISQAKCGSAAMATAAGFSGPGEFTGFPRHPVGYPAALRPVLATALELNVEGAETAWDRLINAPRQPRFQKNPSFAILAR